MIRTIKGMKGIKLFLGVVAVVVCFVACGTPPAETVSPVAAEPVPEPEPAPVPAVIQAEDPSVEITQEEYDKTFAEVEGVINELNTTIKAKNMRKWEEYLTPKFRGFILSRQNLAELNEMPLLKRNNITITSLKDYFDHVVAPSRANVRLDNLKFTDQNRVQAFMKLNNEENVLIYQLEKINNNWKISVW
jgi:hypothetical protein